MLRCRRLIGRLRRQTLGINSRIEVVNERVQSKAVDALHDVVVQSLLFADSEDVYPSTPEDPDIEDGMIAPSVDPIPASGKVDVTVKGRKVKV